MNTEVSFEIAKLLKEKGIVIEVEDVVYYIDEVNNIEEHRIKNQDVLYHYPYYHTFKPDDNEYQTYTIVEIVMWFYEKHGIWIECLHRGDIGDFTFKYSKLKDNFRTEPHYINEEGFNSPTEAYTKAIEHCLNKLI